jgi:hypothetical protein
MFAEVNASCAHSEGRPSERMLDTAEIGIPRWCPLLKEPLHLYLSPERLKEHGK